MLGDTAVSAIGFGDVRLALTAARGLTARDAERALHAGLTAGITLVECSEERDAEQLCGNALRELRLRDRVVVATVAGDPRPGPHPPRPEQVTAAVEQSLRATRLDALPLATLPIRADWQTASGWPELLGSCARLVRDGKVLRWAARCDDPLAALTDYGGFVAVARADHWCRPAEPIADHTMLARQPLAGGALGGDFGPGVALPPHDDRRKWSESMLTSIAIGCAHLARLVRDRPPAVDSCDPARAITERGRAGEPLAVTVGELALRWVIDRGACALVRLHRRERIADAIAIGSATALSSEAMSELARIAKQLSGNDA